MTHIENITLFCGIGDALDSVMKTVKLKPGMYILRELDLKKYKVVSRSEYKVVLQDVLSLFGAVLNVGEGIKIISEAEALKGTL